MLGLACLSAAAFAGIEKPSAAAPADKPASFRNSRLLYEPFICLLLIDFGQ
jgi:hypothetical protein